MTVVSQNYPIIPLPHLYVNGCDVSIASTTVLAIAPGQARDGSNTNDLPISFPNLNNVVLPPILYQNYQQPLLVNCAVNGANGLDLGSLAASSQYAVYMIGDSRQVNPTAGLVSLSSNANPLLPNGYDLVRLIAFVATDSSSHFVYATNQVQSVAKSLAYYLSPPVNVLSAGNATTFTAVNCNTPVPTGTLQNVILELIVTFIPSAVGDLAQFRPTGSSATANLVTITGVAANVAQTQYLQIVAGVGSSVCEFDYKVSVAGDSLTVLVAGWIGSPHVPYPT